ncbi:hypothetical protein BDQ17DRAFT_1181717, partial [Cyathus striatus]
KGASGACLKYLYISQAVPHIMYAADLFLTPPDLSRPSFSTAGIAKLHSLQQQAALLITGGLRSMPNDALDKLAGLLPFHLLL